MEQQMAALSLDLATQLSRLSVQAKALHEASKQAAASSSSSKQRADNGTQVDTTPRFPLPRRLPPGVLSAPFAFQPCDKKISWRRIWQLDLKALAEEGDPTPLLELYDMLARADIESENSFNLSEGNLLQLFRASQLMLQYMRHKLDQGRAVQELMEQDQADLQADLAALPDLQLQQIGSQLEQLQHGFQGLADHELALLLRPASSTGAVSAAAPGRAK